MAEWTGPDLDTIPICIYVGAVFCPNGATQKPCRGTLYLVSPGVEDQRCLAVYIVPNSSEASSAYCAYGMTMDTCSVIQHPSYVGSQD